MAYKSIKIKSGMGGSRSGKSRSEKTEVLKHQSKMLRRWLDKQIIKEQVLNEPPLEIQIWSDVGME